MKKIITLAAALLIGASGAAFAQKQDAPKPAAAPAVKPAAAPTPAAAPAAKADAKADAKAAPAAEAKKDPMDINTASEKELASLPKIGEVRAKAIVKGRPYNGKDDLINKKIIPQDAYDAIKDSIIAKQAKEAKKEEMKKEAPKKDEKKK